MTVSFSVSGTTHEHRSRIVHLFIVCVGASHLPVCDGTFSAEIHKHTGKNIPQNPGIDI